MTAARPDAAGASSDTATAVVIVTYNAAPWLRRNLDALRGSTRRAHVIVVDNASSDATCETLRSDYPEVELLPQRANLGFGVANNVGIAHAMRRGHAYSFLLNQDAFVLPETIARLEDFMAGSAHAVASPLHCSPDADHVDDKMLRSYLARHATAYLSDACLGRVAEHYDVRGLNAAAWFVRNAAWRRVGGFDPLFFMYGEDDDLIRRFAHHGCGFALLPHCRIVHLRESVALPRATGWQLVGRRAARRRAALLVVVKKPGVSGLHALVQWFVAGVASPALQWLIDRDSRELLATWRAAAQLLRQWPRVRRHAVRCATIGAHFLPLDDNVDAGSSACDSVAAPLGAAIRQP